MGQRVGAAILTSFLLFLLATSGGTAGCDRSATGGKSGKQPTVASLVPAATDLLIGMGVSSHLVAVSNWDPDLPEITGLPRVGDYRTIDWEKLSALRPKVMIVQFREDKVPTGLADRASSMGIRGVNEKINRLDDLFATIRQLGEALDEKQAAADAESKLRSQLAAVKQRVASRPVVSTLMTRAEPGSLLACVGGGNYLDEILTIAGGQNVLGGGENSYPTIDREMLIQLDPAAVLALLPSASPQVLEQTQAFWKSVPEISAVRLQRVHVMSEPYLLLPGLSVGKVAELFAEKLHPATSPSTTSSR
jgi:iron complex transport system substrate-binding protein